MHPTERMETIDAELRVALNIVTDALGGSDDGCGDATLANIWREYEKRNLSKVSMFINRRAVVLARNYVDAWSRKQMRATERETMLFVSQVWRYLEGAFRWYEVIVRCGGEDQQSMQLELLDMVRDLPAQL